MTPELDYSLAFTVGILGSGHCIGMCGALASGFFMRPGETGHHGLSYIAYHGARISVYALIGVIAALMGVSLVSTGLLGQVQGVLQIAIGLLVILIALDMLGLSPWHLTFGFLPKKLLHHGFTKATAATGSIMGAALAGSVNGLMPCPLTFTMAIKAATVASPLEGALLMLAFGAGTLPSMLFVTIAFSKLSTKARGYMLKGAAVIVIVMGVSTLYQGFLFLSTGQA